MRILGSVKLAAHGVRLRGDAHCTLCREKSSEKRIKHHLCNLSLSIFGEIIMLNHKANKARAHLSRRNEIA